MGYNEFDLVLGVWGLILFCCAIAEMIKLNGNLFPFSLGAAAAVACYALGLDLAVQVVAFAAVCAFSFVALRPLFKRFARRNVAAGEEGLDLLVGHEGKVIAKIDPDAGTGRVLVEERAVKAAPADPRQKYNVGDRIVVADVDADTVLVEKPRRRG